MITRGICSGCEKERFIVNKHFKMCEECNYKRTHGGKSKGEVATEKSEPTFKFKKYYIKPKKKEVKVKSELSRVKTEIELEAVQSNEYFCKGCGCSYPGLDKSHILSIGRRKDLELVKENMQLLCRSCHMAWESWNIERMLKLHCFYDNLAFIKEYDDEVYNKLLTKIEDHNGNYFKKECDD